MSLPKTILTERLELRPFLHSDAGAILDYSGDPAWQAFQQTTPSTLAEAEHVVAEFVAREWPTEPAWAISIASAVVGVVTLVFTAGHRIAQLGYGIHARWRGLGLTGEAVRAVLDAAFSTRGELARVAAHTDASNESSRRLLERLGFTLEGTLRSGAVSAQGELVDGVIYSVLREEWAS